MFATQLRVYAKKLFCFFDDRGMIPYFFITTKIKKRLLARKIFLGCKIKWDQKGYWILNPMPSELDLNSYYENIYWDTVGKLEGINQRDLDHFYLIKSLVPDVMSSPMVFLNFGAGHGGISHLMHLLGNKCINVEPSGLSLQYQKNWKTVSSLDEVLDKVDFVYSSHSLEHVQDIDKFLGHIKKILQPDGHVFWEVPNGVLETLNGKKKDISHHTYFFTKRYFNSLNFSIILNETFKQGTFPNNPCLDEQGEAIRFLGKNSA